MGMFGGECKPQAFMAMANYSECFSHTMSWLWCYSSCPISRYVNDVLLLARTLIAAFLMGLSDSQRYDESRIYFNLLTKPYHLLAKQPYSL